MKIYLLVIGAIIALPFVYIWQWINEHQHLILQLIWTSVLSIGGGIGLVLFIASLIGGNIILTLMSFWCYISLTTLAMYDYKYILRRFI